MFAPPESAAARRKAASHEPCPTVHGRFDVLRAHLAMVDVYPRALFATSIGYRFATRAGKDIPWANRILLPNPLPGVLRGHTGAATRWQRRHRAHTSPVPQRNGRSCASWPGWEDVQRLLASTRGDRRADIRDHAILLLLAVYGFRRGEVAGLRLDDLDWAGERILVSRRKQRRTQCYPLLPAVGEAILRYLREVRPRCEHRALFLALGAPIRPLSAQSITPIAHARLSALGITLSPPRAAHCLRHACASHLLAAGFSLKQIGDHLGHRSANSTLSYTKVDLQGLRQVAELDLGRLL